MFTVMLLVVICIAVATFVAGLLVIMRDSTSSQNRWFFVFTTLMATWTVSNYINSSTSNNLAEVMLRIDFASAILLLWAFANFSDQLFSHLETVKQKAHKIHLTIRANVLFGLINAAFLILIVSGVMFDTAQNAQELSIQFSAWIWPYVATILCYFVISIYNLLLKRRELQGKQKKALNIIMVGLFIAFIANMLTSLVFPFVFHDTSIVKALNVVGYIGLFIFTACIYFAITRQRLFDIRQIVARTLAYILSIALIAGIYSMLVFTASLWLFDLQLSASGLLFLGVATVFFGLSFQPLKSRFDTATTHIFNQDAYSPQDLYDRLNRTLVLSIELQPVMHDVTKILHQEMKTEFAAVYLDVPKPKVYSAVGKLKNQEIIEICHFAASKHYGMLSVDDLLETDELRQEMMDANVALLVRLAPKDKEEGLGYIVFGPKRSGNLFTDQDLRVLDTVAKELLIATQNALHFEEIQQFNLTLQEKVDEATRKLRASNEKLRKLDETKDEFISMASHQLRTPLTSVKGYLSMVLEGDAGELKPQQAELLKQSFLSSERMVNLIADLLNLSRLNTGKFVIESAPTDLRNVVEAELAQLSEAAKAKDIELKYDRPADFPSLMLDENKIHQVVMNFVDNAIYYTPPGGEITVSLSETPTAVEYRVSDTGIGVPKALQHRLFTKFYRADNARRMRPDGTGLGLFMAKKVIIAQGGSVLFDSTEGKGSTFGFRFNKSALAASEQPAETAVKQA